MALALVAPSAPVASRLPIPSPRVRPGINAISGGQVHAAHPAIKHTSAALRQILRSPAPLPSAASRIPTSWQASRSPAARHARPTQEGPKSMHLGPKTGSGALRSAAVCPGSAPLRCQAHSRDPSISFAIPASARRRPKRWRNLLVPSFHSPRQSPYCRGTQPAWKRNPVSRSRATHQRRLRYRGDRLTVNCPPGRWQSSDQRSLRALSRNPMRWLTHPARGGVAVSLSKARLQQHLLSSPDQHHL